MGVGVFSEYLISKTGLNRIELSFAYMMGTILSSLILPFAGKLLDLIGARIMILATGIGLGVSLLFFAQTVSLINSFSPVSSEYLSHSFLAILVMSLAFLMLRQFGQGIMGMVSRIVLAKWFDAKRGLVAGISGIFVSFGFSAAPLGINILMNLLGFHETI